MGLHSNEFAPLKRQRFEVCNDAIGGGPEQALICCNLSGSSEFDNAANQTGRVRFRIRTDALNWNVV